MRIKQLVKLFIPPIVYKLIPAKNWIKEPNQYLGNFQNWDLARQSSTGYAEKNILEKCKNSLLKVKTGAAKQERDSETFNDITYSWPLLGALQHIAIENNNNLSVLDFGGALGSSYFQNKDPLQNLNSINWTIVEQKHFVDCGKENFQDEQLNYEYTIEEAMKSRSFNVIILSGVPQYLEHVYEFISKLVEHEIEYIILDRVPFIEENDRIVVQKVPAWIYDASYPSWVFNENNFVGKFLEKYDLIYDFASSVDGDELSEDGVRLYWKGCFLRLKK